MVVCLNEGGHMQLHCIHVEGDIYIGSHPHLPSLTQRLLVSLLAGIPFDAFWYPSFEHNILRLSTNIEGNATSIGHICHSCLIM